MFLQNILIATKQAGYRDDRVGTKDIKTQLETSKYGPAWYCH